MSAKTVLIVDDDDQIREVLKLYLAKEGFSVFEAVDGLEAVNKALSDKPDIILLDIMLPFLDGFEVCRKVRSFSEAPIILMTARTQEADRQHGLELGANDFVTKPFSPREMVARALAISRR